MNPAVKNIALKLCESAPASVLEILLETLIKAWNDFIRENNLPFRSIDFTELKRAITNDPNLCYKLLDRRHDQIQGDSSKDVTEQLNETQFVDYFRKQVERKTQLADSIQQRNSDLSSFVDKRLGLNPENFFSAARQPSNCRIFDKMADNEDRNVHDENMFKDQSPNWAFPQTCFQQENTDRNFTDSDNESNVSLGFGENIDFLKHQSSYSTSRNIEDDMDCFAARRKRNAGKINKDEIFHNFNKLTPFQKTINNAEVCSHSQHVGLVGLNAETSSKVNRKKNKVKDLINFSDEENFIKEPTMTPETSNVLTLKLKAKTKIEGAIKIEPSLMDQENFWNDCATEKSSAFNRNDESSLDKLLKLESAGDAGKSLPQPLIPFIENGEAKPLPVASASEIAETKTCIRLEEQCESRDEFKQNSKEPHLDEHKTVHSPNQQKVKFATNTVTDIFTNENNHKTAQPSTYSKRTLKKAFSKCPLKVDEYEAKKMGNKFVKNGSRCYSNLSTFNNKTMIYGICSDCEEVQQESPLDKSTSTSCKISAPRRTLTKDSHPHVYYKDKRYRSKSRSLDRSKRRHSKIRKDKIVRFGEDHRMFAYDPSESIFETFYHDEIIKEKVQNAKGDAWVAGNILSGKDDTAEVAAVEKCFSVVAAKKSIAKDNTSVAIDKKKSVATDKKKSVATDKKKSVIIDIKKFGATHKKSVTADKRKVGDANKKELDYALPYTNVSFRSSSSPAFSPNLEPTDAIRISPATKEDEQLLAATKSLEITKLKKGKFRNNMLLPKKFSFKKLKAMLKK